MAGISAYLRPNAGIANDEVQEVDRRRKVEAEFPDQFISQPFRPRYLLGGSNSESNRVAENCASDLPNDSFEHRVPPLRMTFAALAPAPGKNVPNRESCAGTDHYRKCREHNCQTQGHLGQSLHRTIVRRSRSRCERKTESPPFDTSPPHEFHNLGNLALATNRQQRTRRIVDRKPVEPFSRYRRLSGPTTVPVRLVPLK